ncbi:MAG TPA: FecR family protein [Bosea sp. (in: a-proteobacteria)]
MKPDDAKAIDDAAVAWFVRLHDEQASTADRAAFADWLAGDPAHVEAWNELERIWGGLGAVGGAGRMTTPSAAVGRRAPHLRPWRRLAAAAVVLLALAGAWSLAPPGLLADHRTGIGERRTLDLADGSQVELGPESALDISFAPGRRNARLVAGEAFFTVARDQARPFVVEAGGGRVEVLGTAFDVKIAADAVSVAVTKNAVAVSAAGGLPVRLGEGQAVSFDERGVSPARAADLDAIQAWRQDQLVFHDAPLDAVLAELRRYRRGRIQLLGGDLGSRRVTAVFNAREPDAAIATIARSLDLRLLRATSLFVVLSAW